MSTKISFSQFKAELKDRRDFVATFFWEKIRPGGYLLVHPLLPDDKNRLQSKANFLGVKRVVDDFFDGRRHEPVIFPGTLTRCLS